MRMNHLWLGSVLCLGFFSTILAAEPPATATPAVKSKINTATIAKPRTDAGWAERDKLINAWASQGPVDLLMLGDSITQGWQDNDAMKKAIKAAKPGEVPAFIGNASWQKHYASRKPLDAGIGGDQTQHVLWRIDHGLLTSIKPKLVVLMIGTNNSGPKGNTGEEIGEGIVAIVHRLREKLPETKILVLGIFPRATDDPAVSKKLPAEQRSKRGKLGPQNDKLVIANAIAEKAADGKHVFYLDIGPKFLDQDGHLPAEIMPDYLHLSPKGYEIWADAIEPKVAELLEEKK